MLLLLVMIILAPNRDTWRTQHTALQHLLRYLFIFSSRSTILDSYSYSYLFPFIAELGPLTLKPRQEETPDPGKFSSRTFHPIAGLRHCEHALSVRLVLDFGWWSNIINFMPGQVLQGQWYAAETLHYSFAAFWIPSCLSRLA